LKELGIRVQVNSDAHYPERINNSRAEALAALKKVGFDTVVEWHGGQWKDMPLLQ
jgi:histidinol-phosphatase (PHP family)